MDWFRHDLTAHDDRKIRLILKKGGLAALGAFWWITEMLYASGGYLEDEAVTQELEIMDGLHLKDLLLESGLFALTNGNLWSNKRILDEIEYDYNRKEQFRKMGTTSAKRRSNVRSTHVQPTLNAGSTPIPMTNDHKDYNLGRPSQEENLSNNKISETENTEIVSAEPEKPGSTLALDPVFITLLAKTGKEVPITESKVRDYQAAYPAVDVKAELRKMRVWCQDNPTYRKTEGGMSRFVNNWLSKNQDRSGRIPQQNSETIRGTNIRMSLVADGTRPEIPEKPVVFE